MQTLHQNIFRTVGMPCSTYEFTLVLHMALSGFSERNSHDIDHGLFDTLCNTGVALSLRLLHADQCGANMALYSPLRDHGGSGQDRARAQQNVALKTFAVSTDLQNQVLYQTYPA